MVEVTRYLKGLLLLLTVVELGEAPENTLAAFSRALGLGTGIEMDVRLSADNEIVVIHDSTVNRTTNGSGSVASKTLAQLKALDAGSHFDSAFAGETIPTLAEVFSLFSNQAPPDALIHRYQD